MPNQFNQNSLQQYGGVAWAKQQVGMLDPGAIQSQIDGYNKVTTSLNQIIQTLNTSNASLQSAWEGDAATAAAQTFKDTSNHTQNVVSTVNNTIAQLNQAKSAAETAQAAMAKVPNEKPVPAGNWFVDGLSDIFTGTDPVQQAKQHNSSARTQASDVINSLSNSYDGAATNLNSISGTGSNDTGFTPTSPPSTGTYNLGAGSYGSGSSGAATYSSTVKTGVRAANVPTVGRSGAVTNGVFEDEHTSLQDVALTPPDTIGMDPETGPYTGNVTGPTTSPFIGNIGGPFSGSANGGGDFGLTGDDGLLGDGGIPGESNYLSGRSNLSSSGVFGEDGFNGSGPNANGGSSLGNGPAEDEGAGAGAIGEGQGQSGTQGGMGGARRGGAGGGGEEEELGSSRYSRGRYFGGEEPGSGRGEWVQPSVGGDESLIVGELGHVVPNPVG
jgi:uncharacterized protein YukE